MSNYSAIIGSAQSDINAIRAILVTLRDNGKRSVIPPSYKEYKPSSSSLPDSTVDKWHAIGISPIASNRCGICVLLGQNTIKPI